MGKKEEALENIRNGIKNNITSHVYGNDLNVNLIKCTFI